MAIACTIVARNYLPYARVLHVSFAEHHRDVPFCVLLIDDEQRQAVDVDEGFRVLRLKDLGLTADEIAVLAAIYDVTELATAVKPRLLRTLRDEGQTVVLYLDPDIRIFGPLDDAFACADRHTLVLTPHTTVPLPRDDRRVGNAHILAAGVYDPGFVAVGRDSDPFLQWWWEQTRREALSDPLQMMFTDQRWIDMAPCFFDHILLKHPGYNVAYWNLHGREVTHTRDGYLVNGEPLKFFHFSGFDYQKPHLLSKHQLDRPRILLSEHPAVAALCRDYAAEVEAQGAATASIDPYGWDRVRGELTLTPLLRRLYWRAVVDAEQNHEPLPPGPFDPAGPEAFVAWLAEPLVPIARPVISRYLFDLYERRGDLQKHFPDLAGKDGARYLEWVLRDGVRQEKMALALQPTPADIARARAPLFVDPERLEEGVNVAGYFFAEVGVGEAARLMSTALRAGKIPSETLSYDATHSRQNHVYELHGTGRGAYDVNLICVNADMLPRFRSTFGSGFFEGRHTVGYWYWEVDDFPPAMWAAFDIVDEVWVGSSFVAEAVGRAGMKPVYCVPPPLLPPDVPAHLTRRDVGIPEGFTFLFVFDYLSVFDRKNPCDLVDAFTRAFKPREGPRLVIKSINGEKRLRDRERLVAHMGGRPDVVLLEDYLSVAHKNALMGFCDCYVSLHRSEGLGLTMAEAMGLGKPVIATGYSGNTDFMTEENSFLVDHRLVPVPAGCDPYPPGTPWAQPDVDQAAALMRRVYLDQREAGIRGRRARADILTRHSPEARATIIGERLAAIRREREARAAVDAAASQDVWNALLDRAEKHLPPGPSAGGARGFVRRLLMRALRPYWFPQRALQQMLIDALRLGDDRAAGHVDAAQQRSDAAQKRVERRLNQVMARLDRLEGAPAPDAESAPVSGRSSVESRR